MDDDFIQELKELLIKYGHIENTQDEVMCTYVAEFLLGVLDSLSFFMQDIASIEPNDNPKDKIEGVDLG